MTRRILDNLLTWALALALPGSILLADWWVAR